MTEGDPHGGISEASRLYMSARIIDPKSDRLLKPRLQLSDVHGQRHGLAAVVGQGILAGLADGRQDLAGHLRAALAEVEAVDAELAGEEAVPAEVEA